MDRYTLKVEPLIRSAGNVYFVLGKVHSGRAFESLCKKINGEIRQRYGDIPHQITSRRKWRHLSRGQMLRVKVLAKRLSS